MYTYLSLSLSPHIYIYIYTNGCVYYIDNIMIIYLYIYIFPLINARFQAALPFAMPLSHAKMTPL